MNHHLLGLFQLLPCLYKTNFLIPEIFERPRYILACKVNQSMNYRQGQRAKNEPVHLKRAHNQ